MMASRSLPGNSPSPAPSGSPAGVSPSERTRTHLSSGTLSRIRVSGLFVSSDSPGQVVVIVECVRFDSSTNHGASGSGHRRRGGGPPRRPRPAARAGRAAATASLCRRPGQRRLPPRRCWHRHADSGVRFEPLEPHRQAFPPNHSASPRNGTTCPASSIVAAFRPDRPCFRIASWTRSPNEAIRRHATCRASEWVCS